MQDLIEKAILDDFTARAAYGGDPVAWSSYLEREPLGQPHPPEAEAYRNDLKRQLKEGLCNLPTRR